jgi:hypothetical protein
VQIQWRYYKTPYSAHWGALKEVRWAKPDTTVAVIDIRIGSLLGQYVRTPTSIKFYGIKKADQVD